MFDGGKDRIGSCNAGMLSIIKKGLKMVWNKHVLWALACGVFAVIAGYVGWDLFTHRDLVFATLLFITSILCVAHGLTHLAIVFKREEPLV